MSVRLSDSPAERHVFARRRHRQQWTAVIYWRVWTIAPTNQAPTSAHTLVHVLRKCVSPALRLFPKLLVQREMCITVSPVLSQRALLTACLRNRINALSGTRPDERPVNSIARANGQRLRRYRRIGDGRSTTSHVINSFAYRRCCSIFTRAFTSAKREPTRRLLGEGY